MKKTLLVIITILTVFFPLLSLHFSFSAEILTKQSEEASIAREKMQVLLRQIDRSINENEELIRNLVLIRNKIIKLTDNGKKIPEFEKLKQLLNQELENIIRKSPARIEFSCIFTHPDGRPEHFFNYGEDLGLKLFTGRINNIKNHDAFYFNSNQESRFATDNSKMKPALLSLKPYIERFLTVNFANKFSRLTLRDKNFSILLCGERLLTDRLTLYCLADMTGINHEKQIQNSIKNLEIRNAGIAVLFNGKRIIASEYLNHNPKIKNQLSKLLLNDHQQSSFSRIGNHCIMVSSQDTYKNLRFACVMPLSAKSAFSFRQNLILAIIAILACCLFKIMIEKLLMNRGPDLSFKFLLPAIFLFIIIQPVFAATIFLNDYFQTSYMNEKNRVSEILSRDLESLDLATLEGFRDILNQTRSFSTIERMEKKTGIKYNDNENELALSLMQKLHEENKSVRFSSLWLTTINRPFAAAKWEPGNKRYAESGLDNPLTQFFHKRFQQILREETGLNKKNTENTKLDEELKGEFSRDFFLKILGPESYFKFRQNKEIFIGFNSTFKKETMIGAPISFKDKTFAYAAWHVGVDTAKSTFPASSLRIVSDSPRLAFSGNERTMTLVGSDPAILEEQFPELINLGRIAHVTRARAKSHIEKDNKTVISEARPANHSYFTIAGSEQLKSFQTFKNELATTNINLLAMLATGGILLAFAGAMYFIWPLRELTEASREVDRGNYSARISEKHPDEFAMIAKSFNNLSRELEEGSRLKNYVSGSVLKEIQSANDNEIAEKSQSGWATIIFSSIKGFSDFQKQSSAEATFNLLQKHLQAADNSLEHNSGEIDKMIEDKIMIVFEHDENDHEIVEKAIKTAIRLNQNFTELSGFKASIGINSGRIVAGIMGAPNARLSRTVVGDPVNLAARLASLAVKEQDGAIIISGNSLCGIDSSILTEKLPISQVKGKTQAVEAYKLILKEQS